MITLTHRPAGSGHPYAATPDQRVPVLPVAGEGYTVGVVTDGPVSSVVVEVEVDGVLASVVAERFGDEELAAHAAVAAGGEGHLAEAQAAAASTDGVAWTAALEAPAPGSVVRYRFVADSGSATDWFTFTSAGWTSSFVGSLEVSAADGVAVRPSRVEWLSDGARAHRVRFVLPLADSEHVVGFGERFDAVDQRGLTPDSVVFEQYKSQGEHRRTYFPMPFAHVVGGDGWGFHVDTSRRVWFDVGAARADELVVEAEAGPDGVLDLSLYAGDPTAVLGAFLDRAGRAEVLPDWVHRLWASGNEWNTQALVMEQMDAHRDHDIPVGVVVIEAWSDEEGITIFRDAQYEVNEDGGPHVGSDFTYPADGAWPDPKAMIAELHERGIKTILWQIPLLKSRETFETEKQEFGPQVIAEGDALVASGHAIREEDGSAYHNRGWWFPKALMPDLSTAEGREAWTEHRRYLVEDLDIDGFKTDGGEHAWGAELRYADGTRGDDGNNLNPVRYAQAFGDLLRSAGKAPVTFSRAGFTGSQPHGVFWAGDENSTWEAFRSSLRAGLTAASCGVVYWGWDIAGFSGPLPSPELYVRAAAASVFMPVMQYHSEFNHHQLPLKDRTPWNIAAQTGDESVIEDWRHLVKLREKLVPYLAESASVAVETDRPMMRPLFFDWPEDPEVWRHPYQFMCGDALLVSPVVEEGVDVWATYLPAGEWVDVWSGEVVEGGRVVESDVSARTAVAVFTRAEEWERLAALFG